MRKDKKSKGITRKQGKEETMGEGIAIKGKARDFDRVQEEIKSIWFA